MGVFVAFCSFLALALGPGLMNAYGVYEEEYSRLYDNKDGGHYSSALGVPVIFIGVIQIFIANTLRPIGSRTMHKLGPGPCVFVGGIIMSIGLLSASYSQHIWELCLTQGVVFGVGVCLVWVSAASAPSSWFIKNCSMVTGITHMGLGIGGFVYSQLTRYFLEKSGTGGSLRWLSLTTLVGATVVSLGIHNRHYEQPCQNDKNKPAIPSVRWSRFLEDQVEKLPELDHDSDADFDDCENTPSIAHKKANGGENEGTSVNGSSLSATAQQLPLRNTTEQLRCHSKTSIEIKELDTDPKAPAKSLNQLSPAKPKTVRTSRHVHFAPDVYRKATLDKLESLARDDSPLDRRRRTAIYSQNLHRHSSQARAPQTDVILSDNVVFDLATTPCDADAKTRTGVMVRFATIARNWRLCLFVLGTGVGQVGWYLLLLLITSISVSVGLDVHNAAMILGTINAASAVGRFAAGYAADMVGPTNALLLFTVLATASSAILFISSLGFHLLVTYGCLCGASIGAADPLASMAAVTQFGTPRAITTISMIYGSIGVFVAILAPNARVVIERLGSGGTNFAPFYADAKGSGNKDNEGKGPADSAKSQSSPASKSNAKSSSAGGKASDSTTKDATTPGKEGKVTKKMLKEAEQELVQLLLKKKQADRNLMDTEASIYDFETSYFESSGNDGNIVHGFEGYLNTGRHERRQMHFTDADRIFSQSSATFKKAQEARIAASFLDSDSDESISSHATGAGRPRMRKNASAMDIGAGGGSTIKHHAGNRQGTPGSRGTPTPAGRTTKKIKLSMDAS
ncbi:hypothetical protein EV178_002284 [Coemansia sp. RSA 1646]|nr:hypothetical protein EV178_002284 [Coemansia sp. RSA 1646]